MTLIAKKTISFVQRNNKLLKLTLWSITLLSLFYLLIEKQGHFTLELSANLIFKLSVFLSITAFLNWFFEVLKWKNILKPLSIGFGKAWASILQGLAVGFITPNRVGEFAGRVKVFSKELRWKVAARSWQSSIHQALITWSATWVALGYLFNHLILGLGVTVIFNFVIITLLNRTDGVFLKKVLHWLKKDDQNTNWFKQPFIHWSTYGCSLLRYFLFLGQYAFVLLTLGIQLDIELIVALVALQFTLMHFVPNIGLAELGVREVIAVILFNWVSDSTGIVALGTFLVWIFNLFIPTLIGVLMGFKSDLRE